MTTNAFLKLPGPSASAIVRAARTAADAPAAGLWTPDNLNAAEIGAGVTADMVTLDGRTWDDVYVLPVFNVAGGTSVVVTPLIAIKDALGTRGRVWAELAPQTLTPLLSGVMPVRGHVCAFRVTTITLGAAANVKLMATGGKLYPPRQG
jgi:hypothetical protein